ncbi:MAG TPA: hypothetical protein PLD88_06675, partial [Candidatus Berkiella sp.]|nr:hypothetical protein [Candidatus Berkiella sp.]
VVIHAASTLTQKGAQAVRNKIKPNTEVPAISVARIVSQDAIEEHKQKLQAFLEQNPEAAEEVEKFTPEAREKLVTHACFDKVFTVLATKDKEYQKDFFQKFAIQHSTPASNAICKKNTL